MGQMRATTYRRLTNGAILVAIFAAVMFDRTSSAKSVFLSLGILSAVAAVMIYFVNQWGTDESKDSNVGFQVFPEDRSMTGEDALGTASMADLFLNESLKNREPLGDTYAALDVWLDNIVLRGLRKNVNWKLSPQNIFSAGLGQTYADEVVKIVCGVLAAREQDTLEFEVTPNGSFTIRRGRHPTIEDVTQKLVERFDSRAKTMLQEIEN